MRVVRCARASALECPNSTVSPDLTDTTGQRMRVAVVFLFSHVRLLYVLYSPFVLDSSRA